MPTRDQLPGWLNDALVQHRQAFSPVFRGFLSNHLPMTAMALWHGGAGQEAIETWMREYETRLDPAPPTLPVGHWRDGCSDAGAFSGLAAWFDDEIARSGIEGTLANHLPALVSGWVSDAFHPMIRLGYGCRFNCASEVAAGLAYLAIKGPNARLETLAAAATPGDIEWPAATRFDARVFDDKANEYLASGQPRVALPDDPAGAYAEAVLDILNATQDFFALHLVTGLHAYRVATAAVPDIPQGMLAAGLVVGYAAAGAPAFEPGIQPSAFNTDFEHVVKLAFAVSDVPGSPAYARAAQAYRSN